MAELTNAKASKQPRVDLTPMVDLGFLLITFFIFTTSMTNPAAMNLVMPDDSPVLIHQTVPAEKTLNVLLGKDKVLWTYKGNKVDDMDSTNNSASGLRRRIIEMKTVLRQKYGTDTSLVVLIKPGNNGTYASLVDCMDEVLINDIRTYVLMDPSKEEKATLAAKEQ